MCGRDGRLLASVPAEGVEPSKPEVELVDGRSR